MSLTTEQRAALRRAARIELARRSLLDFVRLTHPNYQAGWFHIDLCERLEKFAEAVERKESPRLIIAVPPRHGKTVIVSQRFPIWAMAKHGLDIICASYGADLAYDNSREARTIARSDDVIEAFPGLAIDESEARRKIDQWDTGNGKYKAVGVGGALTGHGCDVLIIDDPIKDRQEARSPTTKRRVHEWYTSTAYTRLAPGGGVIVMATRWAEDDLTGFLIDAQKTGDKWEIVSFPAIAEENEEHRRIGEALHPERFSLARLEQIKRAVGSMDWASLYQQRPSLEGGSIVKREWIKWYRFDPQRFDFDRIIVSVDATFKGGITSDFVVIQAWGKKGTDMYLLDQIRARMGYVQTRAALLNFKQKWHLAREVIIEDKANGSALLDELKSAIPGLVPYSPTVSKEERLQVASVYLEAGQVYFPESAPWVGDLVEELLVFPNGKHDDQVDGLSMSIIRMTEQKKVDAMSTLLRFGGLY